MEMWHGAHAVAPARAGPAPERLTRDHRQCHEERGSESGAGSLGIGVGHQE
jgi:hypothetical protein